MIATWVGTQVTNDCHKIYSILEVPQKNLLMSLGYVTNAQ